MQWSRNKGEWLLNWLCCLIIRELHLVFKTEAIVEVVVYVVLQLTTRGWVFVVLSSGNWTLLNKATHKALTG